jgi:hypothetical protein
MHKYQPRVHVIRKDCGDDLSPIKPVPSGEGVKAFSFPETVFTTVTAYQNQQVLFSVALFLGSLGVERKPALFMVISKG